VEDHAALLRRHSDGRVLLHREVRLPADGERPCDHLETLASKNFGCVALGALQDGLVHLSSGGEWQARALV
jgi:hypothetical protein